MRLDKWLWAARFFKTRRLAAEAVAGGKVHLEGQRTKPGRDVQVGSKVRIHKGSLEWDLEVLVLPTQRRPAKEAVTFYRESESSILRRRKIQEEARSLRRAMPTAPSTRPTKKERRVIQKLKYGDR